MRPTPVLSLFLALVVALAGFLPSLAWSSPASYSEAENLLAVLSGQVLDDAQGVALPGANVHVTGQSSSGQYVDTGMATDLQGRFEIDVPDGTYSVTVSFVGFETWVRENVVADSEAPKLLTIRLAPTDQLINPITITASRSPERLLDAPAAITVLEPKELRSRTALTAATHLASVPAVDIINTGLVSSRIVVRGFNDNLASSLLTLVDNRIARAPSVRLTALQLIPMSNGDIEQIEVVSGPASALYGPNAANGVVHILTRSPFDSRGTSVSLAGGQRDIKLGSFRHAGTRGNRIGYKVSGQYYTGDEFEYRDPEEISARANAIQGGAQPDTLRIGQRDFTVRNLSLNSALEIRHLASGTLTFNAGITFGDNIEITPTGSAQVNNARIGYGQIRYQRGRLFAQTYGNFLHTGDSYFLRTGQQFTDVSRMVVGQIQHYSMPAPHLQLTYGVDALYTMPQGEGTVNGRNESDDNVAEVGGYLQADWDLRSWMSVVGAARADYHNRMGRTTFSPRAALVLKPRANHTLRATYNRAFVTPLPNDLFSDILGQNDVFLLGQMRDLIGFAPITDLRVQGMETGFSFSRSANGRPQFRSPFAPLDPRGLSSSDYIDLDDPAFVNVMWSVAREATVAGLAQSLADDGSIPASSVDAVSAAFDAVLPTEVTGVRHALKLLNLDLQVFVDVKDVEDAPELDITRTRTFEVGYKGLIGKAIIVGIDAYRTTVSDFKGPYVVGTPNVFLDGGTLNSALLSEVGAALAKPENAEAFQSLLELDQSGQAFANGDGDPTGEVAFLLAAGLAGAIPFGTVSPVEAFDPTAVMLFRRNFGEVTINGLDANVMMFLSRQLRFGLMGSWLSDNYFRNVDGVADISLNAPRYKLGFQTFYDGNEGDLGGSLRARYVDGFRVRSDVYVGAVSSYFVVDASMYYRIPFSKDTMVNLTIQNLTDNRHREFVFVPEMGRLTTLRLTHEF
jgi:outer membrane receptor for ferrienterochelin and colicins